MTTLHPGSGSDAVGELDLHSSQVLEAAIAEAQAGAPSLLVIDLTGVSFLASIAITVLLEAVRRAGPRARIRVAAPEVGTVRRVLRPPGTPDRPRLMRSMHSCTSRFLRLVI